MPIHPAMASKFRLLEGISSFQQFVADPALADRRKAFDEHPGSRARLNRAAGCGLQIN